MRLQRYNAKVIEVPSAAPKLLISSFIQDIWPGDLFNSLVKKLPTIFENLLDNPKSTSTLWKHR